MSIPVIANGDVFSGLVEGGVGHALEIPGVVPPGGEDGDLLAVVLRRQLDLAHGEVAPLGQRRPLGDGLPGQGGPGLLEDPGIAEAPPADHGHVRAGLEDVYRVTKGIKRDLYDG